MNFVARPPSQAWELLPASPALPQGAWLWWKPPQAPGGLMLRLPEAATTAPVVSLRAVLGAVGIDPRNVANWTVGGAAYAGHQGQNPLLDAPLPPPAPGVDPTILVQLAAPPLQHAAPSPSGPQMPLHNNLLLTIDHIAADWNAATQLEYQLSLIRKQLHDSLMRVNVLNRDLSNEERMWGDKQDLSDWQDARRWLRDVAAKLSKMLKDHDMGMASAAGRRTYFESIYEQVIAPRRPCAGLDSIQREFEQHRKTVQTLLLQMNSVQSLALQDGERRAQQVLARIAVKVRMGRTKR